MNQLTMETLKLVASFLTPLIIVILGIAINRKLEIAKTILAKEMDWQKWWTGKFLSVCHDCNSSITDIVAGLFQLRQIEDEKVSGWESELKEKVFNIRQSMKKLQHLDWEIKNYMQFAPDNGRCVLEKQEKLFNSIASLINTRKGDFEEIRKLQFGFNEAVRLAHAEILGLDPNKTIQHTVNSCR